MTRYSTSILTWISNYTFYKVWDDIIYPTPDLNDAAVSMIWEIIASDIGLSPLRRQAIA